MKKILTFIFAFTCIISLSAQTADVTIGCVPLNVKFQSPVLTDYYWTFGEGSDSDVKDPGINYTSPGEYLVELFEGLGGAKIGELTITVLPKPEILISADPKAGCTPLQVKFTNESNFDPNTQINGFLWTFGDGASSDLENPSYTYPDPGLYEVSLRLESDLEGCSETLEFPDYISVSPGIQAGFSLNKTVVCEPPATFEITNNTFDGSGYTYMWDFGNGDTATGYNPPDPSYDADGTYTIQMIVDSGDGCVVTLSRDVIVGKPKINIEFPDTVCLGEPFKVINNGLGNTFVWSFGNGAVPQASSQKEPVVVFNQAGSQIVTFSAIANSECQADTFFTVFVEDPKAAFAVDPVISCLDPSTYTLTHPQSGYATYEWYIRELDTLFYGGPEYDFVYDEPDRDSFYISRPDTFTVLLNIVTTAGCTALDSLEFYHRAPQAHFVPSVTRGCAPLNVSFDETSVSNENIISWDWMFGDGTTMSTNTPDDMTHTYTEPGEYYVQLIIENEDGCIDTSNGVFIYVGEPLDSEFTIDQTEICLYETVNFEALNLDPRIDAWHFDTDDGRISDCYETPDASHTFIHAPGTYPVILTLEYNGCFSTIDNGETITVNGSKSRIKYMTNCIDPYTVMLQDSSLNASTSIWYINGDTINMDTIAGDVLNYTFDASGDYVIKLWTDDNTMCDPDSSTVDVYIRDIEANFDLPEAVCAYTPYEVSAAASIDVDETCSKGYEWFGVANRPRQIDTAAVTAAWLPGPFSVRLIVEDLNGCKDTLDKESNAYELEANFETSLDEICFPNVMSFTDLSTSDTSIVAYQWSFDDTRQNPENVQFVDEGQSFLTVEQYITDAIGCMDTARISIPVYQVTSNVTINPNPVCIGNTVNFTATDYTQDGSFLNFTWSFGEDGVFGTSSDQNTSFVAENSGIIPVQLIIVEDSTGCSNTYINNINVVSYPEAAFIIDDDDPTTICPNESVEFENESVVDGNVDYFWDFGNGLTSTLEDAASFFQNGPYDITLIVTSSSDKACSDTITQSIELIAPSGDLQSDKELFCLGETVSFTIENPVNISTSDWTFGDGNFAENVLEVSNPYTFLADTVEGQLIVSVIIESETGCKDIITKILQVSDLEAGFEILSDTSDICLREVEFMDRSLNAETYFWDFGNGVTSTEQNPTVLYTESDSFTITQTVQTTGGVCVSTFTGGININNIDTVRVPTVFSPNSDGTNDFFDIIIEEEQRECIEVIRSKIFNRWGNKIYDNAMPIEGWDGRFENGEDAPAEIYTYILEVLYVTGESEVFKGTFTLIR